MRFHDEAVRAVRRAGPAALIALTFAFATLGATMPARAGDDWDNDTHWGSDSGKPWRSAESFHWTGNVPAGKTIKIRGINGAIRAEYTSSSQVSVDAERRGRRSDPDDVKIEVTETSDGVMICARYPRPNGSLNDCEGDSKVRNNDVEVKFTLRVPAGVHVAAQTVNGGIQLIGLRGDAKANTVNGSVRVSTSGTAEASTVNGGITVDVGDAQLGHDLSFNTVNGGVDVMLPANVNADVRASTTNGTIDTDFPVSIQGRWGPRTMSGTLGKGGSNLSMTTVNGSIHLRSKRRTIRSL